MSDFGFVMGQIADAFRLLYKKVNLNSSGLNLNLYYWLQ